MLGSDPVKAPSTLPPLSPLAEQTQGWDATETAARVAKGEVSAEEAARAAIERAQAWEPHLAAIVQPLYEEGLAQARLPRQGCFAGVPTFVKDMENLIGAPTLYGTAALPTAVARSTAASVAEFMSTGPVALGKSTTAEFGLTCTTEPVHGRPTRNPVDLTRTPGGSSGGAAALVAAKVVPIAHGGDGGGSIRIPAAWCGLVGLKATRGRLAPMDSTRRMPIKIATYGVLTRTVRDTAAFYAAVERAPRRDMPPIGVVHGPGQAKLRVGLYIDPPLGTPVDPEVRRAIEATARRLEQLGHRVEPISAGYDQQLVDDFLLHWGLLAAGVELTVRRTPGADVGRLEPWTRALAAQARRAWWRLPAALLRLRRFPQRYAQVFAACDVVLSPATAAPAPKLGHLGGQLSYDEHLARLLDLVPFTPIQNASGTPAISVPVGTTAAGLPIGAQLAAPWGHERRLLELAFALEA